MLVGITGKAGSGKDTVADMIAMHVDSYIYRFADPVKAFALAIDPIVEVGINPDGTPHSCRLSQIIDIYGSTVAKRMPEVRRLYQRVGTEGGRAIFGENCWVDLMLDEFYSVPHHNFLVPDTRFQNEARAIQGTGHGVLLRIFRGNSYELGDNAGHASETEQDSLDVDFTICNDGDLQELDRKVRKFIEKAGLR